MQFRISLLIFTLAIGFGSVFTPTNTIRAQGLPLAPGSLQLITSTDNPIPGQQVTITAQSFSVDISGATIVWNLNGKTIQKGIGMSTFETTAPALGKKNTISVTAIIPNGQQISATVTIGSGTVDLIVESDGYAPPFFKGKVPLVFQNKATVVAIPHIANSAGVEYDPKTLVYTWKKGDTVLQDQNGYGRQSIVVYGDIIPRPYNISVSVTPRSGGAQASAIIPIDMQSPSISLYANDPLYGTLFNRAIKETLNLGSKKEMSVLAVPYGFNKPLQGLGDLSLAWMINGISYPELSSNESIILRSPDGQAGSSNIQLGINAKKNILQSSGAGFSVVFGSSASSTKTSSVKF